MEGRCDSEGVLSTMRQDLNNRWDVLHKRVTVRLVDLRHSIGIYQDFDAARVSLMDFLTGANQQLTEIEQLSQSESSAEMKLLLVSALLMIFEYLSLQRGI